MNASKAFTYVFEDKDWLSKVLIGSAIVLVSFPLTVVLVGFLGFAVVAGYTLEVLRNVRQGRSRPLPAWQDRWSEWMVMGLKLLLVSLIWGLPSLVLNIPSAVGNSLAASDNGAVVAIGLFISLSAALLMWLWALVLVLVTPALYIRLAETGEVRSTLQVAEILGFTRRHFGEVLAAVLVSLAATLVLFLVGATAGVLLCVVGLALTIPAATFLASLISVHLYAQIGQDERQLQPVQPVTPEVVPPDRP
ncbi:MAG: DUF4013 domain-containing protein [Anaerolineae bacterium]|nr:DUF4013 domain-containing protein [Anaerolineae bacterium]